VGIAGSGRLVFGLFESVPAAVCLFIPWTIFGANRLSKGETGKVCHELLDLIELPNGADQRLVFDVVRDCEAVRKDVGLKMSEP